ncbi:probable glycosyltransferase At5g03795 isoform X2 [Gastrolobium bilobum]|uniref:probable glycosyltransferase At5g03795 isoform X2 n=1 Tax=Gastrolobium bilobum TaxID=150636 RepID=UPI002AB2EE94|nr:probable glycosyltransferase At5g03795 isoform X2 [Gastrolobium bilobum]
MLKKWLQHIAFTLMRELSWRCFGNKIDWGRLILLAAILTVSGFVFQMLIHSYLILPNKLLLSLHETDSLYRYYNSTVQPSELLKGARLQQVQLSLPNSLIMPNSSNTLVQSVSVKQENLEELGKEEKKLADTTKIATLSSSPHGHVPSHKQRQMQFLPPNEALMYAKKEIDHAPSVSEDPNLYAPLFRNVSVFRRSYELMETILKVYIYRDGARPIFHKPYLKGIYASEGWFMKLMEENKQFVTKDPEKAHLFYLPYSARQMEQALYVPGSHNLKPLSIFLRDYVIKIAAKYPFWNRTHGVLTQ